MLIGRFAYISEMATHSVTGSMGHSPSNVGYSASGTLLCHRERFTGWRRWIRPVTYRT